MPKNRVSVRKKIITPVVLIILFMGVLGTIGLSLFVFYSLTHDKKAELEYNSRWYSSEIETVFSNVNDLVKKLSENQKLKSYLLSQNPKVQDPLVYEVLENYNLTEDILAIYILNTQGMTLLSTDPSFLNNDYSFREYFQVSMTGVPDVDVALGVTSKELGYYFSYPVFNRGEVVGVAVIKVSTRMVDSIVRQSSFGYHFTDRFGVIVGDEDAAHMYKSLDTLSKDSLDSISAQRRYLGLDITSLGYSGVSRILQDLEPGVPKHLDIKASSDEDAEFVVIEKIPGYNFYLFLEESKDPIVSASINLSLLIFGFIFITILLASMILSSLISIYLKPIYVILAVIRGFLSGDTLKKAFVNSNDEFADLAESFNQMTQKFTEVRQSIEQEVSKGTAELKTQQTALLNIMDDLECDNILIRQQQEDLQKFKLAVDGVGEQIVITDPEGIILYANRATENISGFTRDETLGTKAGKLWGGLMSLEFYKEMWDTIKYKKISYSSELKNKKKNGSEYYAEVFINPILDSTNEVVFFVAIERDVTKVREVDRLKTEFISLASHQLRTPLSAMKWFLEMLLNGDTGVLTKEQLDLVKNLDDSNERMIALVNSLLNISRIESGRIIIDSKPTDPKRLLLAVMEEEASSINKRHLKVEITAEEDVPKVSFDPKLISNALQNLISNSVKYTQEKGHLKISLTKNDNDIVFMVADDGYGIPQKDHSKLFQKFYRGDNVVKLETEGNGLGLYLTRQIVEASGGKIWFISEENKGSTFWFSLPLTGSPSVKGEVGLS